MTKYECVEQDLSDALNHFYRLLDKSTGPNTVYDRLQYTFIAASFQIGFAFLASIVIMMITPLLPKAPENIASEIISQSPTLYTFFIVVFLGPMLEEGLFRIWLGRVSYVLILVFALVYFALSIDISSLSEILETENLILSIATLVPALFCIVQLLRRNWYFDPSPHLLRTLFWVTTITFGLFHVPNYVHEDFPLWLVLLISPILFAPQLIGGYIFAVCRIRAGLLYAMLAHAINNCVFAMGLFLTS